MTTYEINLKLIQCVATYNISQHSCVAMLEKSVEIQKTQKLNNATILKIFKCLNSSCYSGTGIGSKFEKNRNNIVSLACNNLVLTEDIELFCALTLFKPNFIILRNVFIELIKLEKFELIDKLFDKYMDIYNNLYAPHTGYSIGNPNDIIEICEINYKI